MYSDTSHLEQKVLHTALGNWNYIASHKGDRGLLFLHGANSSHRIWHQQMGLTIKGYKSIFVDLLGYGGSDKPSTGYHLSVWIAGLRQILQQEGVQEICVVAHSNGVIFAKELYRACPQQIVQLILLDGMLKLTIQEPVLAWMRSALERSDYQEFMAKNIQRMPLQGLTETDQAILRYDALNTPQFIAAAEFALVSAPATWAKIQIDCPTTIVHTNNPSWDEAYQEALKLIAPQHKLLLWEDAGHFIPMQFPERLADLIKDVLQ